MKMDGVKRFFSVKFNVYLIVVLLIFGGISFYSVGGGDSEVDDNLLSVHYFYLPECPHCADQKPIYYELRNEWADINFLEHDASTKDGSSLFYEMAGEAGLDISRLGVPTIFVKDRALVGFHTKDQISKAIDDFMGGGSEEQYDIVDLQEEGGDGDFLDFDLPILGKTDLTKWSLPMLSVVLGLIDGFNPCAMWVLVYLIGILIGLKDKKKIWIIVGSFVFASGVLYFLFMTAWLNIFLLLGYVKILTIIIGLVAFGGGVLSLKEYFTNKGALVCNVTDVDQKKKTMNKIQRIIHQPLTWGIVLSMIGLAFVINSIEFACSAAIPAVFTQILSLSGISTIQNYLYIGLYTFFFMLDDLIIFGMAAFAIGGGLGDRYAKYSKLIGGVIMVILGFVMLFAPELLT